MTLIGDPTSKDEVDSQLERFLEIENGKQRFQELIRDLTDACWEISVDTLRHVWNPRWKSVL